MCYDTDKTENANPIPGGYATAGMETQGQIKASSFRDRLESRRNSLTRQLTQVEQALQLIYTNPDAEKIHDVLKRTGVI